MLVSGRLYSGRALLQRRSLLLLRVPFWLVRDIGPEYLDIKGCFTLPDAIMMIDQQACNGFRRSVHHLKFIVQACQLVKCHSIIILFSKDKITSLKGVFEQFRLYFSWHSSHQPKSICFEIFSTGRSSNSTIIFRHGYHFSFNNRFLHGIV